MRLIRLYRILSTEERQKRLNEFRKNYDENDIDENLRKEKTRIIATLSQYFGRGMILEDEYALWEEMSQGRRCIPTLRI
jgi:hypothetical protein